MMPRHARPSWRERRAAIDAMLACEDLAGAPSDRFRLDSELVVRDAWSDDPDRTTRRGDAS